MRSLYINLRHFETTKKIFADEIDSNKLRLLMEVDVINCVIHEYAHIKLREVSKFRIKCSKTRTNVYHSIYVVLQRF